MKSKLLALLLLPVTAQAAVTGIDVKERSTVLSGKFFGAAGAYERIAGKARFALDPKARVNRVIVGLTSAPRNENGLVEFTADLYVLRPANGNGTILFEVSNRGGKGLLQTFNLASAKGDDAYGDGFLLNAGYTLVWLGWQFDVAKQPGLLGIDAPVARGLSGPVRADYQCTAPATKFNLANAYPVYDLREPSARLAVRETTFGTHTLLARDQWHFADSQTVEMENPCQPGKSYDVVYTARAPAVAGVGAAAIRDLISSLKSGQSALKDVNAKRAIAFGTSQSGRFLRQFIYDGFNTDEGGKQVFDAVWPHISGAAVGSFNHRFAQPSPTQAYYPLELFPFHDLPTKDPITGRRAGLLDRASRDKVIPKIFYTLSSNEYWGRSASLIHTSIDGGKDVVSAPETRIYHISGSQHGGGQLPLRKVPGALYESSPTDYRPVLRALLVAMQDWLTTGKAPPPSAHATAAQMAQISELRFPAIPGLVHPRQVRQALPLDFGPKFVKKGIISHEPARVSGKPYASKLPQMDRDGNEASGIRLPSVAVPLATYFAWNVPSPSSYSSTEMLGLTGSHIAFPKTKAERAASQDPRLSIEERYQGRADYLRQARAVAAQLATDRYLLESDIPFVMSHCERHWDILAAR